ncbi:MAG: CHAT domain-containing protein, partial [Proteobacteria bacterium]|nr:CHAT domain-containing protein [Pseudomonadota bacterium]
YATLLAPVEPGWRNAKSLIVVPHGGLGQLPLALLPTQEVRLTPAREGSALFSEYKQVPWLLRKVSIAQVPSVAAFAILRALPPGDTARQAFIGFGDPYFSAAQAADAERGQPVQVAQVGPTRRGAPLARRAAPRTMSVDSAELAMLPRLPETAEEIKAVAAVLGANPVRDVYLGRRANEAEVKRAPLHERKVVMFATHGLVPGELNGLTQPALALTAPQAAGGKGDGLLTMEDILGLRLDADWVVLSACNTAAGEGAGAEAVSGLGRAFFYAGARSLLVSNWPVETTSARDLTIDLFRREARTPGLSRAEALRQTMLALIDGDGRVEGGKTLFSYAHPLFWAPFALIGDGGASVAISQ